MSFAFDVYQAPTEEDKIAWRLGEQCRNYIFFSREPTAEYLAETLKWIEGIGPSLESSAINLRYIQSRLGAMADKEKAQYTGPFGEPMADNITAEDLIHRGNQFNLVVAKAIRFVQANRGLSKSEFRAKYPTLIVDSLAEAKSGTDCDILWVLDQLEREIPNLLSPLIHRDRLGDEIDKVLGLGFFRHGAIHTRRGKRPRDAIIRYSSQVLE
jgi:hypothetical protein